LVERNVNETLTYYAFPDIHWQKIRTTDEIDKRFLVDGTRCRKSREVHSFVRPRRWPFFRPRRRSDGRRAQGRSRLAAFAATTRLGLD